MGVMLISDEVVSDRAMVVQREGWEAARRFRFEQSMWAGM